MDLNNKNILVIGLGVSGVSTIKALNKLGARLSLAEARSRQELEEDFDKIKDIDLVSFLEGDFPSLDGIDLVVKNPGVPFDHEIILSAKEKDIDVVTDLELAYRLGLTDNLVVITGTNGKTTTTSLVGEIFKEAGRKTHIIGNIGLGILWELVNASQDDIAVVEASSFQLDGCSRLKPKVSSILNITPDHINWHGSFDNYLSAKEKVVARQDQDDFAILNYDDERLRFIGEGSKARVIWFSRKEILDEGVFLDGDRIIVKVEGRTMDLVKKDELKIPGAHNIENALAAVGMTYAMGVDIGTISKTLRDFKAVEHRIEYVDTVGGIEFYNDSKGTNIDASIKALEALEENIVLIAGGADKGCSYDDFVASFKGRVKSLVLLGQTKYDIERTALDYGFTSINIVDNMEEAVDKAYRLAEKGDRVLLSPACASLDMYRSYEARGEDFKENVGFLKEV